MLQKHEHIPLDVTEIILSKLPIRDVLRFRAVSKSWNAIILNPRFARNHLNKARYDSDDDENQLFVWPSRNSEMYHIGKFNGRRCTLRSKFEVLSHLQCPLEEPHPSPLCSCDGFFLIYDRVSKICLLWNPITQSKVSFAYPETRINTSPDEETTTHGICYDSLEDDYKVIFVNVESLLYTVLSCRNGSWTKTTRFPYSKIKRDPGVSAGGIPYWAVADTNCIVYFDAKECRFKIDMPINEIMGTDHSIRLSNLNGRLCIHWMLYGDMGAWVLTEENAWIELEPLPEDPCWSMTTTTLLLTEDGERVHLLDTVGHKSIFVLFEERQAPRIIDYWRRRMEEIDELLDYSQVVSSRGSLAVMTPSKTWQ